MKPKKYLGQRLQHIIIIRRSCRVLPCSLQCSCSKDCPDEEVWALVQRWSFPKRDELIIRQRKDGFSISRLVPSFGADSILLGPDLSRSRVGRKAAKSGLDEHGAVWWQTAAKRAVQTSPRDADHVFQGKVKQISWIGLTSDSSYKSTEHWTTQVSKSIPILQSLWSSPELLVSINSLPERLLTKSG